MNIQALFATVVMAGPTVLVSCLGLGLVRLLAKKAYDSGYMSHIK